MAAVHTGGEDEGRLGTAVALGSLWDDVIGSDDKGETDDDVAGTGGSAGDEDTAGELTSSGKL